MSSSLQRLHGLEDFLENAEKSTGTSVDVRAEVLSGRSYVNLRGNASEPRFVEQVGEALGQALPLTPNKVSVGEHNVYWLGPDEWMICGNANNGSSSGQKLQDATSKLSVSINDVSGGWVTIRLTGDGVRRLLSKGCTLDFHQDLFKADDCAQGVLAKANVIIGRSSDGLTYDVLVRRSFADYLALWLQRAAGDTGIEFRQA